MKRHDEFWWAFLDGEMTPVESSQYEQSTTPGEREQLADDLALETELGEVLSAPVTCPDAAWKDATARIHARIHAERHFQQRGHRRYVWLAVPLAAAFVGAVYLGLFRPNAPEPPFLTLNQRDVAAVAAMSEVSDGVSGVRAFMDKLSLPVMLNPADALDGQDTPYRLLGVCTDQYHNERVVQLLFDCEQEPATVVIAKNGGYAAQEIGKALAAGTVRASRSISDVVIAVVGPNAPHDLIRVVNDHWPEPQAIETEDPAAAAEIPAYAETSTDTAGPSDDSTAEDTGAPQLVEEPADPGVQEEPDTADLPADEARLTEQPLVPVFSV